MAVTLTAAEQAAFAADGFIVVRGLFSAEEVDLLSQVGRADHDLNERAMDRQDGDGKSSRLSLTSDLGDDLFSVVARCRRMVDNMGALLGGEPLHYHHKMMMKEAGGGGAWQWHQDYGYWYNGGFLRPDMASCMIAVDRATRENGCLQVLRGSHLLGRLNHGKVGDQTGADLDHVAAAEQVLELVYCEMAPGDVVFFHSNTLHRSDANLSDHPRWAFICCYTRADNVAFREPAAGQCRAIEPLADEAVLATGRQHLAELTAG